MIVVYHNNKSITRIEFIGSKTVLFDRKKNIAYGLMQLAIQFPEETLVWCHEDFEQQINLNAISVILHHQKMMLSYDPSESNYLGSKIGYVEESPFIKVNKKVTYPTWQMSSKVGVIHAIVLLAFKSKIKVDSDFDYYLSSIAKVGMPLGLLCYSEPKLLIKTTILGTSTTSVFTLFKFVKQHYKTRWIFLLLLNLLVYEFRFPFVAFIYALIFKDRNKLSISLDSIVVQSNRNVVKKATIDVIIPTIGRKKYLYDVLQDLAKQTHLPTNVIIVEQNPQKDSVSELDYLLSEKWPFAIKHTFTHQAGACNARNLALSQVESEWVFMADDDIRIDFDFIEKGFAVATSFGIDAITFGCYEANYQKTSKLNYNMQWSSFGSGCSIVKINEIENLRYNKALEFGYGEDTDYGLQLRNKGKDIVFAPIPELLHLKASIGGFRTKPKLQWQEDTIQPKPSPTVLLYKLLHQTKEQVLGYKTTLFFKFYQHQSVKNPFRYFANYRKQWKQSMYWANELNK
ncbi:Glyco_tranf_GTA_type domain containing protein [Flavobacteriaceae bacterium]